MEIGDNAACMVSSPGINPQRKRVPFESLEGLKYFMLSLQFLCETLKKSF